MEQLTHLLISTSSRCMLQTKRKRDTEEKNVLQLMKGVSCTLERHMLKHFTIIFIWKGSITRI